MTPDSELDVIVIGAGACGGCIAYELAREGVRVAVVEAGETGREASWASAGIVGPQSSPDHDPWFVRATTLSKARYDELETELRELTGRDVGYGGRGSLVIARTESEAVALQEDAAVQTSGGVPVEVLAGAAARQREPALPADVRAAALNPDGRHLDARAFTAAIVAGAVNLGASVFPGRPATGLLWEAGSVIGVATDTGDLRGDVVINAAGAWAGRLDPRLSHPVFPVHGQIMSVSAPAVGLRHTVSRVGRYGYATPRVDGRVVVGATHEAWGFARRVTPEGLGYLAQVVTDVLPALAGLPFADVWTGLRPGTIDSLPTVGPDPRASGGFLWATGHYSTGMMQMPATALVVSDLVRGREPRIDTAQLSVQRYLDRGTVALASHPHDLERRIPPV